MTKPDIEVSPKALADKTVVITGPLEELTLKEAQELVKEAGGKISDSVSKNTDLLIAGEKAGSKLTEAKELNIKVFDEEEFIEFIDNSDFVYDPEENSECVQIGDGEWAVIDPEHGGEVWITQECADAFYWDIHEEIEYELDDDGKIDDDDGNKEYFDKGFKYKVLVLQVYQVVNYKGREIRTGYEDQDVYALNEFTQEMLDHPGCEIMGWCDG